MRPSCSLAEVLPHRPPMVLIDEIVEFDEAAHSLAAEFTAREEWAGNWSAIEYMAQTAAALVGMIDRASGRIGPARTGFLLGTRRLTLDLPRFEVGAHYRVTATCEFADDEAAAFSCALADATGRVVATAVLNAYRPENAAEFVREHRVGV